jgi:hypothetical protein
MKTTIITGADASFFDLLWGLVQSIRACPESREVDLCILDVGLSAQQIAQLTPHVTRIVPAGWDFEFPGRLEAPSWYKAMYCRPFFPRYFPEYDLLVWIDADAWMCNWEAMKLLMAAAGSQRMAIVPEIDRTYTHCYQLRPDVLENLRGAYLAAFGEDAARRYPLLPVFNCGVFAMLRDVPHWKTWSEIMVQALQQCLGALIEQCALNVAAYTGRIPVYCLPSWCNWNAAHAVPMLNPTERTLHAPLLPHEAISIVHLTDIKRNAVKQLGTDGATRLLPLTYDAIRLGEIPPPFESTSEK